MMKNDFADKVTEYHILNAQLMSKAMLLLDNANDFMANRETFHFDNIPEYPDRSDFVESTIEYGQSDELWKNALHKTDNSSVENDRSENPSKIIKFSFPPKEEFDPMSLYNGTFLSTSFSENEEEKLSNAEKNDLIAIENSVDSQQETEHLVDRLLKTKISLKQNGFSKRSKQSINGDGEISSNQNDMIEKKCVKILKSKCEELNEEIQGIQEKLKKKTSECQELMKVNQTLNENKVKLSTQINSLKSQMIKKDGKITALNSKIQIIEAECQVIKNERDSIAKTAKGATQEISGTEMKLAKALREISSLKETLNSCKHEDKEAREISRKQVEELSTGLKTAEKREKMLLATIKKQALLLDNLKKQINYLTSKIELNATEKRLDSILNWENI